MKILYAAAFVLLSHSLSAMHVRALVKAPVTMHKPVLSVVVPQKRNFSDCKCAEKVAQELCDEDKGCWDTIEKNKKNLNEAYGIVAACKDPSSSDGKWTQWNCFKLERELQSNQYCLNFGHCASQLKSEVEKKTEEARIFNASAGLALPVAFFGGGPFIAMVVYFSIMASSSHFQLQQLEKKEAGLTKIAQGNIDSLSKFYEEFTRTLALNSPLLQELQKKNKEKNKE